MDEQLTISLPQDESEKLISLRHEYTEAALSVRHYSALRFVMFSIYVAIVAALGGVALGMVGAGQPGTKLTRVAAFGALLVTYVFFTCEVACRRDRQHFRRVMRRIEPLLSYASMTIAPKDTVWKPALAFGLLFAASLLFWLVLLCRGKL